MADFNSPDTEYGGGGPSSFLSADGTRFWGALVKQGGILRFVVYQTAPDGTLRSTWADSGIVGQGAGLVVQPNGVLEAVGYTDYGDGRTMRAVPVPGWKPWPQPRAYVAAGLKALLSSEAYSDWKQRIGW